MAYFGFMRKELHWLPEMHWVLNINNYLRPWYPTAPSFLIFRDHGLTSSLACITLVSMAAPLLLYFALLVPLWLPAAFSLPKGSVLGSLLYFLSTPDLGYLLASCSLLSHCYAYDVQSYTRCSAIEAAIAVRFMSGAINSLFAWMSSNRLRLSPSKTQYIWFGTRQPLAKPLLSLFHFFYLCSGPRLYFGPGTFLL